MTEIEHSSDRQENGKDYLRRVLLVELEQEQHRPEPTHEHGHCREYGIDHFALFWVAKIAKIALCNQYGRQMVVFVRFTANSVGFRGKELVISAKTTFFSAKTPRPKRAKSHTFAFNMRDCCRMT